VAKSKESKPSDKGSLPDLDAADVRNWLNRHPEFLKENADLLMEAAPPSRPSGEGVVDMQSFLVERLQSEVRRLTDTQNTFVAAARINQHTQKMIHASVQLILSATGFAHFVHILTQDLPEILEVDVITLCIEDGPIPLPEMTGLQRLKAGSIDRANWHMGHILMRPVATKSRAIFGPAMDLVYSDSLIKLEVPSLHAQAMLAIGSREEGHFHPDQGTELLAFLATCTQSCLQMWLENTTP
jgi:uncharacterized protein YigA (DUF484 family)